MKVNAWVLKMKNEHADEYYDGDDMFLCNDESVDFLTNDLQNAEIIWDKEAQIKQMKNHDEYMIEKYGKNAIRNFGWEHISKHFNFLEVEVI